MLRLPFTAEHSGFPFPVKKKKTANLHVLCDSRTWRLALKKEHTGSNKKLEKIALNISPTAKYTVIRSRILRWDGNRCKEIGTARRVALNRISQK
jgi:hypothetical protein